MSAPSWSGVTVMPSATVVPGTFVLSSGTGIVVGGNPVPAAILRRTIEECASRVQGLAILAVRRGDGS